MMLSVTVRRPSTRRMVLVSTVSTMSATVDSGTTVFVGV